VPERKSAAAQGFGAGFGQTMAGRWKSSVTDLHNPIRLRHGSVANSTQSSQRFPFAGFHGADSMPAIATDLIRTVPSIVPSDIPAMSDDECLLRLAQAIEDHDSEHLDEVARLIGRLAVTIE
jgi:hypothetical protein